MFSISAIKGTTINPEPMLATISVKLWSSVENGGAFISGRPCGMSPISLNGAPADCSNTYPIAPQTITKIALRDVPISQKSLLMMTCFFVFSSSSVGPILIVANI